MTDISELNALRARIDELEAKALSDQGERDEGRTSRRGMLRLAGAAAVGGIAAVVTAEPVAADAGHVHMDVAANAATLPTGISVNTGGADLAYGLGCYESGLGALPALAGRPAVFGHATDQAFSVGVAGHSTNEAGGNVGVVGIDGNTSSAVPGIGVLGFSASGWGVVGYGQDDAGGVFAAGAGGALVMDSSGPGSGLNGSHAAPPLRTTFFYGNTLEPDLDKNLWHCYQSGFPGKWRKLSGPATAGAFHAITPTRVYDSRAAAPSPGLLAAGLNRLVSVADGRDPNGTVTAANLVPAGATAVAANVTVTATTGEGGFLAVNPGGVTAVSASTINWFGAGQNIANGVTLTLNATRELTVVCGVGGGSTHFIIDIAGYYL